jgi:hypothetical protein
LIERFLELSDFGGLFEGLFAGFGMLLLELFQLTREFAYEQLQSIKGTVAAAVRDVALSC